MPQYTARRKRTKQRKQKKITKGFTRDKRILKRWAVEGTEKDYQKLRRYADTYSAEAPEYVLPSTMDELATIDRRRLIAKIHDEPHGGSWFMDGLNWLLHRLPGGWKWITKLGRAASKPWQGDSLQEIDEEYAKLLDATYQDNRPELLEHWKRMPAFDGEYCAAWVSADGHVLITVRGTKLSHLEDLGLDLMIAARGSPLDTISNDIRRILESVPPDKTVDLAAHSLGSSLALVAFEKHPALYARIHQTYLYNAAFSPFVGQNVTEKFEKDPKVRYFISLSDPVSIGALGNEGPVNVVYRTGNPLKPMAEHDVGSWYPGTYGQVQTEQIDDSYWQNEASAIVGTQTVQPASTDVGPDDLTFGDDGFFEQLERRLEQT